MPQKECVFCTDPNIQKRTIIRTDLAWAFPTNVPIVPGHTLIAPIRCVAKLSHLTREEHAAIFELNDQITNALTKVFKTEGFNFAWNEGESAGQSIPHFHLHVLPRKSGDTGIINYEPRQFLYRPGSREESSEEELQTVANLIKQGL
jgi:diadenosine tetraphosphate (Ap4A) HIT family hydrolase